MPRPKPDRPIEELRIELEKTIEDWFRVYKKSMGLSENLQLASDLLEHYDLVTDPHGHRDMGTLETCIECEQYKKSETSLDMLIERFDARASVSKSMGRKVVILDRKDIELTVDLLRILRSTIE